MSYHFGEEMKELIDLLHEDEGLRLHVYDDATGKPIVAGYTVVGNPTIGYGRLLTKDRGITQKEADYLFSNDLQNTIESLRSNYWWFANLDSVRADVCVSMVYNMGIGRFNGFKKMIAAIEAEDWDEASTQILDSRAARELPARYGRLAEMMKTGKIPTLIRE